PADPDRLQALADPCELGCDHLDRVDGGTRLAVGRRSRRAVLPRAVVTAGPFHGTPSQEQPPLLRLAQGFLRSSNSCHPVSSVRVRSIPTLSLPRRRLPMSTSARGRWLPAVPIIAASAVAVIGLMFVTAPGLRANPETPKATAGYQTVDDLVLAVDLPA